MLSEKIDTTVSKGVLRVAGTAIGGTIGKPQCLFLFSVQLKK